MSEHHFAADLLAIKKRTKKKKEISDNVDKDINIQLELRQQKEFTIPLLDHGERICVKYIDIYGNEFTEELKSK